MPARNPKWILFILLIAAPVVFAATDQPAPNDATKVEPAIRPVESSPTAYSLTALPAEKLARLTPLQVALRNVLLQEQADLAPLIEAFARETDSLRGLEIQKQIQTVKQDTELALLRTQAQFARQEGRIEVAEQLEESLRLMTEPTPPVSQTPRSGR